MRNINLDILLHEISAQSTFHHSRLHGESHWLRVAKMGLELATRSKNYDPVIVFLFGALHDTMRQSEGRDPEHGMRAAQFAEKLNHHAFTLSDAQLDTLMFACREHDYGKVTDDPTIGICWDSDRLNLWRVFIIPRQKYLSTRTARQRKMILRGLQVQKQSFTWHSLYRQFSELSAK